MVTNLLHLCDVDSYGFAVYAAWGTFRGGNWQSYCSGLLSFANDTVFQNGANAYGVATLPKNYTYEAQNESIITCKYEASGQTGLNDLPNVRLKHGMRVIVSVNGLFVGEMRRWLEAPEWC